VWLLICGWLFSGAAPCDRLPDSFWQAHVSCLAANEIGDFLGGAFAPLAFLWLIAAVFLQRHELEAQRSDLKLSRALLSQQIEEAKENVKYIREQTLKTNTFVKSTVIMVHDADLIV
jgi:hypothetical protein